MIKVAPTGQKDAVEMRKVYAGFVAKQIEAGSEIIALEADPKKYSSLISE